MFEIDRHIESLLLKHSCVIVPGFGGFMAHHISARYDETDGMMLPPMRTVGFNPQLTLNDSLLVQSYIETYDISYPEALRQIESEVAEMKMLLENEGCFDICSIGRISINECGQYEFEPCQAGILTPELYGLPGVETVKVGPAQEPEPVYVENEHKAVVIPIMENSISEDEASGNKSTSDEAALDESGNDESSSVRAPEWYKLVAACALLLIAFSIPFTLNTDTLNNANLCGFNTEWLSSFIPKDYTSGNEEIAVVSTPEVQKNAVAVQPSVKTDGPVAVATPKPNVVESASVNEIVETSAAPKVEVKREAVAEIPEKEIKIVESKAKECREEVKKAADKKVEKKCPVVKTPTPQTKPQTVVASAPKVNTIKYTIVLASSSNAAFAEDYVKNLHSRGYIAARTSVNGSQIRVVHGRYASYEDASQMRDNLQQLPEFEHCWVLEIQ